MRNVIGILVCLLVAASTFAVEYHPLRTSAAAQGSYYTASALPSADFRSTSVYSVSSLSDSYGGPAATGSFSAISASNFDALNSEDGLCAGTSASVAAMRRAGRPGGGGSGGGGAIGEYDFHSPLGEIPWVFCLLLIGWFCCRKRVES